MAAMRISVKAQPMACGLLSATLRKAVCVPSGVSRSMSCSSMTISRPPTPPAALISFTAMVAPLM